LNLHLFEFSEISKARGTVFAAQTIDTANACIQVLDQLHKEEEEEAAAAGRTKNNRRLVHAGQLDAHLFRLPSPQATAPPAVAAGSSSSSSTSSGHHLEVRNCVQQLFTHQTRSKNGQLMPISGK
jgi:alkanesulfonate monooxygenase SsuD/methylene tetrahydromethanopterin reductase-like flavin-dependent oxidoreductase (luciferase family)